MSKINYVLAKDEDFVPNNFCSFTYIGNEPYIEIPHIIQGVNVTSYGRMFYDNKIISGIKSTNKNILSTRDMFCKGENKDNVLDVSEFDMTNVEDTTAMFRGALFKKIIWPRDKMPLNLKNIDNMFFCFETTVLDLSAFDFSEIRTVSGFIKGLYADNVIFPTKGLPEMLKAYASSHRTQSALLAISPKYHNEELYWAAVLADKNEGNFVKIKSRKILMYLGTDCPSYLKFYYNKEV